MSYTSDLLNGVEFIEVPLPSTVVVTFEKACNLSCKHCYWDDNTSGPKIIDWSSQINQLVQWGAKVIYAGRVLTSRGAKFIEGYCAKSGKGIGIVDNGYTILKHRELFTLYDYINISIDGVPEDHDLQRNMPGSSAVAWEAIFALKDAGLDPIVSSCVTPINIGRWGEFEAELYRNDVPLSCTPVLGVSGNKNRILLFTRREMLKIFERLLKGSAKVINLSDPQHVEFLLPLLKQFKWEDTESAFEATAGSGVQLVYRPSSIQTLTERNLSWNGRFYTGRDGSESQFTEEATAAHVLRVANYFMAQEHRLACELLFR